MKVSKVVVLTMALVFSGSVMATTPVPVPPNPAPASIAPDLVGLGVMFGLAAGFAILAYQDSGRAPRACESEKPVTAKWVGANYQFVTTACDFQAQGNKVVAVK